MLMEQRVARMIKIGWIAVAIGVIRLTLQLIFWSSDWWSYAVSSVCLVIIVLGLGCLRLNYQTRQMLYDIQRMNGRACR